MRIQPKLSLVCNICGWKPIETQTMGEVKEHMKAAHRREDVTLELASFCTCGTQMRGRLTETMGDGFRDHFVCPQDGNEGWIERLK